MMQHTELKVGIAGGILLSLISISYENLVQAALYAAVGALVSYTVTSILRRIVK